MSNGSSAQELADAVAREIAGIPPGTRTPAHRELIRRFGVSATTVSQCLAILAQRGLVVTRPGAGTFRSSAQPTQRSGDTSWQDATLGIDSARSFQSAGMLGTLSIVEPDVIDLNAGYLHPDLQPLTKLTAALARTARRPEAWDRPPVGGVPELRDWFATAIGGGLSRHDILICGAGQSALAISLRAICSPGGRVVIESPTYPGTIAAVHAAGLRPVPVPLDAEGLRADYVDDALTRTGAQVVVVQSLFQNPTGISISAGRQGELREIARRHGAFVIEDDFARYLTHTDSGPTPPPLIADDPDGTVIHVRSLTKVTSSNLRVGAIAARGPVAAKLRAAHVIDTMFIPAPLQYAALDLVTGSGWNRALTTLALALTERRTVAVNAVAATFGPSALTFEPRGGYHLWLTLPRDHDGRQLASSAMALGVAVTPGENYYPTDNSPPHVRLTYAATPSIADIDTGIHRLQPLTG
ncbi:PLP-dependent aminotransferase family protein [Kribbella solani]|uniref:aminotransferase-like domain-containing protein n=1 Tax=Kribbella solani TaxID=236067 RepID=UPI0029A62F6D|nr:PLP-dependent aminotransferase family protein [Kribbella solani]MDX3005091.1 PLP-dependent aminotransferase family protein [Kribbella solani]